MNALPQLPEPPTSIFTAGADIAKTAHIIHGGGLCDERGMMPVFGFDRTITGNPVFWVNIWNN